MSLLKGIQSELQHIIEAMYAVTNIDFTIVDENLHRIVATNNLIDAVGIKAPFNSAFHRCVETGEQIFIEDAQSNPICLKCASNVNCNELAELCIPIHFNNKIIGVLGMCAFNTKAKYDLINNRESYIKFEKQLSNIISTILSEKNHGKMLEYKSSELMTLINSINEGIIILNNNKEIITINNYILEKLELDTNQVPSITQLLSDKILEQLVESEFNCELGPVKFGEYEFIINSSPIKIKGKKQGAILAFSDFNKMRESVLKSNLIKGIITFEDIIGESDTILKARRQAIQVAEKDVSVLIFGESGTGKEVFARAIHTASRRKDEVFMAINCGAIPENLIESELFGYEKGSFTGASKSGKMGKFEASKDGTLFLDEIGDLPYLMQVKLLRALEEKEITRVGGYDPIKVNPRIISATNKDLGKMVLENIFREDLFYRLNIVPIHIPPLRERGYDVIILARYFLKHFSEVYNKKLDGFTPACERFLLQYNYPGNIRELKNLIEYAIIFEENSFVGLENIKTKVGIHKDKSYNSTLADLTKAYEKSVIENELQLLGDCLDAKREVARKLGISIATLYRKLET